MILFVILIRSCSDDNNGGYNDYSNTNETYYNNDYNYDDSDLDGVGDTQDTTSDVTDNTTLYPEDSTTNTTNSTTENDSNNSVTDNNVDSQTTKLTEPTEPEYVEPTKVKITGDTISGSIKDEDDEFYYTFTPTVSGIHRFDFDISNVNADYRFRLVTSKQATKGPYYYSSKNMSRKDHGISIELNAGETYTIIIDYYDLPCDYVVKIGKPEAVKTISSSTISGTIRFTDEVDEYKYTATKTGRYRFAFDISDTNADYGFELITSKQSTRGPYYYSSKGQLARNHGVSIDLTAGETYTIRIFQEDKTCDYTVKIGVPTDVVSFSGKTVNGVHLNFLNRRIHTHMWRQKPARILFIWM